MPTFLTCRGVACRVVFLAFFVCWLPLPGIAQQGLPGIALDIVRSMLDQVEASARQPRLTVEAFTGLRSTISSVRADLAAKQADLEPQIAQIESRLKQLGAPPAAGAPPEEPTLTAERAALNRQYSELDGALKQTRLLQTRADQIAEHIAERRQAIFARQLFRQGASALDPSFWTRVAVAVPEQARRVWALAQSYAQHVRTAPSSDLGGAGLTLIALIAGAITLSRWWRNRFMLTWPLHSRFTKAVASLAVAGTLTVRWPLLAFVCVRVLEAFDLLPAPFDRLGLRFVVAVAIASAGRGIAAGLLAPGRPERRLVSSDEPTVQCLYERMIWAGRILALAMFLYGLHRATGAPGEIISATTIVFCGGIIGVVLNGLLCLRRIEDANTSAIPRTVWLRPIAWVFVAAVTIMLVAGFTRFGAFLTVRLLATVAVIGLAYLLIQAVDALFTESISENSRRGQALARSLGIKPRNIGLAGTLLSGAIRVLLILLALLLVLGPWEVTTAELSEALEGVSFQLTIGEITISFRAILTALVVFAVTLFITRAAQRWLQASLLPRTTLEQSLQLSVATIFGYVGVIAAISLALAGLGIDLQKIAFVAGALSVGIGFGLQAIVSNFVSGLILLTERPIRVGDAIVVGAEEGWVRRIRVRATEIETYDRASVIVPNSMLITGTVKNWTHANTLARIVVKVSVRHGADAELVRKILLDLAAENPNVIKTPPPRVFLLGLSEKTMDFELRCVVDNVENGLGTRSDINFALLARFREAGIPLSWG
jgi:small-conductance mechanosensitive channel